MSTYQVELSGYANFTATVEATTEDAALDAAYELIPELCAHCAGWNRPWSLELGDDWDRHDPTITPTDAPDPDDPPST